jgi:hypothetical protein
MNRAKLSEKWRSLEPWDKWFFVPLGVLYMATGLFAVAAGYAWMIWRLFA